MNLRPRSLPSLRVVAPLLFGAIAAATLGACNTKGAYQTAVFDHWSPYGPVLRSDPPQMTVAEMTETEVMGPVVLTGVVRGVCQTKGCWMTVAAEGADEPVFVKFRNYGFFVPRNAAGRQVVLNGTPIVTEVSVELLRHYGRDAGQSEEEVMRIVEPTRRLEFVADSVLIQGRGLAAPYVAAAPEVCEPEPLEGPAIADVEDLRANDGLFNRSGSARAAPAAAPRSGPIAIPDIGEYRPRSSTASAPAAAPPASDEPTAAPLEEPAAPIEEPAAGEPVGGSILDD